MISCEDPTVSRPRVLSIFPGRLHSLNTLLNSQQLFQLNSPRNSKSVPGGTLAILSIKLVSGPWLVAKASSPPFCYLELVLWILRIDLPEWWEWALEGIRWLS